MQLKLRASGDIQILTIENLQTQENLKVVKAGITKILKSGKNRFVLELTQASSIPAELLREIALLRLLATELSGDLVLAGSHPLTRQRIDTFSKPPIANCFATVEEAVQSFRKPEPKPAIPAATAAPHSAVTPAPVATVPKKPVSVSAAELLANHGKEEIKLRELSEIGKLRKELELMRAENEALRTLLNTKVLERRQPADHQGFQDKIIHLEAQLADIFRNPGMSPPRKAP